MALQDILNAIADRTPFVTEAQRDEIKAQIAKLGTNTESENLGQDTESQETTETPASGNEQGTTEETESSTVVGTTEPPAPETGPVTEVGMGIVPEPPVTETPAETPVEAPAAQEAGQDPSLGILPAESTEEPVDPQEVTEIPQAEPAPDSAPAPEDATNPTEETPSVESGSGLEASNDSGS